jgi:hypothetical protein
MNLMFVADVLVSTLSSFTMITLGMLIFRASFQAYVKKLLAAALVLVFIGKLLNEVLNWDSMEPLLIVLLQATFLHFILKIGKTHALLMALLGSLCYTIIMAGVFFMYNQATGVDYGQLFYGGGTTEFGIKLCTNILTLTVAYFIVSLRLGFTYTSGTDRRRKFKLQERNLAIALIGSFAMFSVAYYTVTVHIGFLFWIALTLCIFFVIILVLLYKKEINEE